MPYEIFEKIKKVLLNPSEFFARIRAERNIGEAFKYLAVISLVQLVVNMILITSSITYLQSLGFLAGLGIFAGVLIYILSLGLSFISAGFLHLFIKLLGGKGNYTRTYQATAYGSTPTTLFGWLPYISILISLYSWYLNVKGISTLHKVSMGRALAMTIIPIIIIGIIVLAAVFLFFFGLFA